MLGKIVTTLGTFILIWQNVHGKIEARCPNGWSHRPNSGQCFLVHSYGRSRSFSDARSYCQGHGGDLIKLESPTIVSWIVQQVAETGLVGEDSYMWVGAKNKQGSWMWVEDSHPVNNTFLPWDGSGAGNCSALTLDSTLLKSDCTAKMKFICHRAINIPPACDLDNGWEAFNDHCYKRSSNHDSWHDGQIDCQTDGGNLATITGTIDQQYVTDFAIEYDHPVWIGLTEEGHKGEFKWVGEQTSYRHWGPDQPDKSFDGFGAAIVDNSNSQGLWKVERITEDHHYLCKAKQGACVFGWIQNRQSCYYFNTEQSDAVVWQDARDVCKGIGADLVVLDDQKEDTFFRNHMPETDTLWIGLYSEPGADDLTWVDDTTMSSKNFTHMTDENVQDALGSDINMCGYFEVIVNKDKKSSWIPIDCEEPRHYACEVPVGQPIHYNPPQETLYCPEDWKNNNGYCYYFGEEEQSWAVAQETCHKHDGELASIITWPEQDFVHNHAKSGNSWIGFNDRKEEGSWVWSDGASVTIKNWNAGEPNGDSESVENCAEMYVDNGEWNDSPCGMLKPFICKRRGSLEPIGPILPTTTGAPDYSNCGWDWIENPVSGECYRIEMYDLSFEDARSHCHDIGHHDEDVELVSLTTAEEQSFVINLVMEQHFSQPAIWIGMKNDIDGDRWLDGTPATVFGWADGEPNGYGSETCIEMYTGNGEWNDATCGKRSPFICEKKGPNYIGIQPPPPPSVDLQCPEGWTYFNNHCYYFSTETVHWEGANTLCQANLGSQLASITNEDENQFISDYASQTYGRMWIGAHDDNNGQNWHWVDGADFDFYTNWGVDEPNNAGGKEHCGEMRGDDYYYYGEWNDAVCSDSNYYVCKITVGACPQGWAYNNKKCYFASTLEETFNVVRDRCKEFNQGADLVSIHSEEENEYFGGLRSQTSVSSWLGYKYDNNSQTWSWIDGQGSEYENWNEGEPNFLESEWCTEMIDYPGDVTDKKWNNLACSEARGYGCEFFPTHTVGCDEGWYRFEDYCYWYSNDDGDFDYRTFDEGKADCLSKGAHMASIHSVEENDFIFSIVSYDATYAGVYIGLTDDGHRTAMAWTDGTSLSYTNWAEMFSYAFAYSPTCGMYDYNSGYGQWSANDCYTYANYVCKKTVTAEPIDKIPSACLNDDFFYKASCYSLSSTSSSWADARDSCAGYQGGHLITINDRYESAFISSYLGEMGEWIWIGLNGSIAEDGSITFNWVTGEPVDYTNWNEFEPDPEHGTCVVASGHSDTPGFWTTLDCTDTFEYVCEYDREGYDPFTPIPTEPPGVYCARGWEHKGDYCYKVYQSPMSWGSAEQYCQAFGAHLTSINSKDEEDTIKSLYGVSQVNATFFSIWVGLELGSESGYAWSDGTAVDYVNWADGQPDSHYERDTCGSVAKSSFKWSVSNCEGYLPFICEAHQGTMISTIPPPTKGPVQKCEDDDSWYLYQDYCYKFVSESDDEPQTWWGSHKKCRDEGGELASIHTVEENYWIESMMSDMSDDTLWIGGQSQLDTGFGWIDGTPFDFDNWARGEPNNFLGQEDCVGLYAHRVGNWNDQNCAHLEGRICKRLHHATFPPPATTPAPDGHCPDGWIHAGTTCLQFFKNLTTNDDARSACKALDSKSDLVSIHSKKEQAHVMAIIGAMKVDTWIGLRNDREFVWYDQTPVTYTNWAPGEPNNAGNKEYCVETFYDTGLWNDIRCEVKLGYICQMPQDPSISDHNPPPACDEPFDNYFAYDGACYRADNHAKTWQEAEEDCLKDGAHLASAHDIAENALIWSLSQEKGYKNAWIGFSSLQDEYKKTFKWSDGWPTFFTNWARHEPNTSLTDHNCVMLNVNNGNWFGKECEELRPFVCKYKDGGVPTPDPPSTGTCPDERWMDLGGGYCYLVIENRANWNNANKRCIQEGGNLVSIHSEEEMGLIDLAVKNIRDPLWIGLISKREGYGWSDDSGYDFMNWEEGEPSSEDEECAELYPDRGTWNDANCESSNYYMCKTLKHQIAEPTDPTRPPHGTTKNPDGPGAGSALSGGAIFGIVLSVIVLVAAVGFVGVSFINKRKGSTSSPFSAGASYSSKVNLPTAIDGTDA